METEQIKALVSQALDADQVSVEGEGCNFTLIVVAKAFAGLMPVKRQQLVYSALDEHITSGAIHAVTMRTYTPEQWAKQQ